MSELKIALNELYAPENQQEALISFIESAGLVNLCKAKMNYDFSTNIDPDCFIGLSKAIASSIVRKEYRCSCGDVNCGSCAVSRKMPPESENYKLAKIILKS